ncbi:hypothetical protein GTY65_24310 [Streptomyces sp. SID8379]|uniref:hypothetical protein n=1 Tax=unclassified Streptomyces TaxID=2593676 RepID=UPI000379F177|nr:MULTISPECIES: hypothetical protein [unclassified Streptomyces]MYW67167.1 hypothetical protein [Streptomyces sp. SID8379]
MSSPAFLGAVPLPDLVHQLLSQTREPSEVPDIDLDAADSWVRPLARFLSTWLDGRSCVDGPAFLHSGYAYLPLPDVVGQYLRVSYSSTRQMWPITSASALLTLSGTAEFEMYASEDDVPAGRPQYARLLGPGDVLAAHVDTLCSLRSLRDTAQVLVMRSPEPNTAQRLLQDDQAVYVARARSLVEAAR